MKTFNKPLWRECVFARDRKTQFKTNFFKSLGEDIEPTIDPTETDNWRIKIFYLLTIVFLPKL
jgi:hypothetical protein